MVTLLQAAFGVSDADAVEEAATNLRWQLVLGCLGADAAPFSQASLVHFRQRLCAHQMDRRLLERTVEIARPSGGFGPWQLRVALDSSPLFGAGKVEDTFNLIGHAARQVARTAAKHLGWSLAQVAEAAGLPVLRSKSIKAGLDVNWDEPAARSQALSALIAQAKTLGAWLGATLGEAVHRPPLAPQLAMLGRLTAQDTEPDPDPGPDGPTELERHRLKEEVAPDRQISVSDPEMRHGRKSQSSRIDGYKRHLAVDLTTQLVLAADVQPANRGDGESAPTLVQQVHAQGFALSALYIDRGYLGSPTVDALERAGTAIVCKAFPVPNGGRYTKADFCIDLDAATATCPQGVVVPLRRGNQAAFPAVRCDRCVVRAACTTTRLGTGRTVQLHAQEALHQRLRARQRSPQGRTQLRERTGVEHRLAHVGRSQGRRARYRGLRNNLLDVRRHSAVANLHLACRFTAGEAAAA